MGTIIFDLFGTLIEKKSYDYQNALRWLADTYFEERFDELQALSLLFKTEYMELRKKENRETSFFKQLALFEKKLGCKLYDNYSSVELQFIRKFREEKLIDGIMELLEYLSHKHQEIYVLSNSLFSGNSLKACLKDFGIDKYIEKVYSSADIGFRKPSKEIFHYVLTDIGISHPEKVFFIGDSLEKDYIGAKESGLTPILFSSKTVTSDLEFHNISSLLKYFQDLYDSYP